MTNIRSKQASTLKRDRIMAKQINPIETTITEYLKAQGIKYSVVPLGAAKLDGWECDRWSVWFEREGKNILETTYHTGIGHRESKVPMPADIKRLAPNIMARVDWERMWVKPVAPHAAGVLSSLLLDSSSAEQNFHDWCDELGYDKDSIKAQGIYNACCETLTKMRSFFTGAERQAMQEILQDY
jgi:hypothetical protein